MSKRNQDKGRLPSWISVFRHSWKSHAWKILSVGARALYVELAANYNTKMQNAVFMSARTGSEQLNVDKDCITKWLRELEHYGFIVKVRGHFLGLDGEGKAALYRLTDRWHAGKEPTYDFQNWTGEIFDPKKYNPVRKNRTPRPEKPDIRARPAAHLNGNNRPEKPDISDRADRPEIPDITSFTISPESKLLQWTTPRLVEISAEGAGAPPQAEAGDVPLANSQKSRQQKKIAIFRDIKSSS
jgi:hypothetical protein